MEPNYQFFRNVLNIFCLENYSHFLSSEYITCGNKTDHPSVSGQKTYSLRHHTPHSVCAVRGYCFRSFFFPWIRSTSNMAVARNSGQLWAAIILSDCAMSGIFCGNYCIILDMTYTLQPRTPQTHTHGGFNTRLTHTFQPRTHIQCVEQENRSLYLKKWKEQEVRSQ